MENVETMNPILTHSDSGIYATKMLLQELGTNESFYPLITIFYLTIT